MLRCPFLFLLIVAFGLSGLAGTVRAVEASAPESVSASPPAGPALCPELDAATALLQKAEQAALARRWPEALADFDSAEVNLREAIGRCPTQAEQAQAPLKTLAAHKAEALAGIHQTLCLPAIDKAFALDNRAASLQLEKKDWADIERLFGQAGAAWGEAAALCQGSYRQSALSNQADTARARSRAAQFLGDGAACDPAFADAGRMLDLAKVAWSERQWEDAGLWYRKAEMAWGMAIEKCAGPKREQALKKKESAAVDAHNAVNCAPRWESATGLSLQFKALSAGATTARKTALHDQVEVAWREAASACRGVPQEKARANADAFTKERGSAPLSIATAGQTLEGPAEQPKVPVALVVPAADTAGNGSAVASSVPPETLAPPSPVPTPVVDLAAPVVTLKAGDTTYSGHFHIDPDSQTVSGEGKVLWDSGNVFTGTLVLGKAEGRGGMRWANGDSYEGEWKYDLQNGKGSMGYANGDRYDGDFANGYPAGRGRYLFAASGDRYEGEVRQGRLEGRGVYLWKNGDRFEGVWRNGMKSGPGRYTWVSGEFQDGQYANDVRTATTAVPQAAK